jgi:hypothetical protein
MNFKRFLSLAGIIGTLLVGTRAFGTPTPTPHATSPGGSYQIVALQGCMKHWLFDGIWRIRVTAVKEITDPSSGNLPGYAVSFEIRNGTDKTAKMLETGVQDSHLVLDDGSQMDASRADAIIAWNNIFFREIIPSAGAHATIPFYFESANVPSKPKPVKWILPVEKSKEWAGLPRYTAADPSFRVDLTRG